jgi:7,8-dihydropterin-6-yl-methyl-4-(beta-D-ribofuranosyl)aminobenzene 5'-phosphate synthase
MMSEMKDQNINKVEPVIITVIYDNNAFKKGLQTDWGFSCVVDIGKRRLLFDTGDTGSILMSNLAKLAIDPKSIDTIFLSHFHHDHTGGLTNFLESNASVKIYYPWSFPEKLINTMIKSGATLTPISSFQKIQENIFSLGQIDGAIPEQSMAVRTTKGIFVITGCAHPGIINILEKAKDSFPGEVISLVLGGFHLYKQTEEEIKVTIDKIFNMGVLKAAPSHCSGDLARTMLKNNYNDKYVEIGIGNVIKIN